MDNCTGLCLRGQDKRKAIPFTENVTYAYDEEPGDGKRNTFDDYELEGPITPRQYAEHSMGLRLTIGCPNSTSHIDAPL